MSLHELSQLDFFAEHSPDFSDFLAVALLFFSSSSTTTISFVVLTVIANVEVVMLAKNIMLKLSASTFNFIAYLLRLLIVQK